MSAITAFEGVLSSNQTLWFALFALAAVDLVVGASRALVAKTFSSTALRQTFGKMIEEAGLPIVVAILAVANGTFVPFVAVALWIAVVAEATSVIEQVRGKQTAALAKTLLGVLGELKTAVEKTTSTTSGPPTGGAA